MQLPEITVKIFTTIKQRIGLLPKDSLGEMLVKIIDRILSCEKENKENLEIIDEFDGLMEKCAQISNKSKKSPLEIEALYLLAICKQDGIGTPEDITYASDIFSSLFNSHPFASYNLGLIHLRNAQSSANSAGSLNLAEQCFNVGFMHWLPDMCCKIGKCYLEGTFASKNEAYALKFFDMAAKKGSVVAAETIAKCYQLGIGTAQNIALSIKCYHEIIKNLTIAGRNGDSTAWRKIGRIFQTLYSIDPQKGYLTKSKDSYMFGTQCGCVHATIRLADCYEFGKGVDIDLTKAKHYYAAAIKAKDCTPKLQKEAKIYIKRVDDKLKSIIEKKAAQQKTTKDMLTSDTLISSFNSATSTATATASTTPTVVVDSALAFAFITKAFSGINAIKANPAATGTAAIVTRTNTK